MKKGEKLSAEQVQKLRDGEKNFADAIQNALAEIITHDEIEHGEMHRRLNAYLTECTGRRIDLEYIVLGQALKKFAEATPIVWRECRYGQYQSQTKHYVKRA